MISERWQGHTVPDLTDLREEVYQANMELDRRGLVLYSFGNASGIDRDHGLVVIKPSGVAYDDLRPELLPVVDLSNRVVAGALRPSSDTRTHTALYRAFSGIGGVVHTHSTWATAWSQAQKDLPCLGTTHADYAHGAVPCTAVISDQQLASDYEHETGNQIITRFHNLDPMAIPMCLVAGHAPFTWGVSPAKAAYHAVVLEELAQMAAITLGLNPGIGALKQGVLDLHYHRKHGPDASYGQDNPTNTPVVDTGSSSSSAGVSS